MSSLNHPAATDIEDAFSSNSPNYTSASPDYSLALLRNIPSKFSKNSYGLVPIVSPTLSHFHDDPYIKAMYAYDAIIPPQVPISLPIIVPPSAMLSLIFNPQEFFVPEELLPLKEQTSTSAEPAMTQAAIRQLVADSVATALEAQTATMASTYTTYRNIGPRETPLARKCTYKEFMSYQPLYLSVKFATGTLTKDALSWWNSYAKPIRIEQTEKIVWTELKRLLTNKYCPQTEVKKMEYEFYNLVVKGNDLKTYARRFEKLAVLCPNVVPNNEKLMEAFIRGLPRSIEGNVTASKPQILEEAITIT
nr:reverse transcriptase domain-containing protein [Tanacetum cinerariifolium]